MKAGSAAKLIVDALLQRFLPLARRRIETAQAQDGQYLWPSDPAYEQVLDSLAMVARHTPVPLLEALLRWRESESPKGANDASTFQRKSQKLCHEELRVHIANIYRTVAENIWPGLLSHKPVFRLHNLKFIEDTTRHILTASTETFQETQPLRYALASVLRSLAPEFVDSKSEKFDIRTRKKLFDLILSWSDDTGSSWGQDGVNDCRHEVERYKASQHYRSKDSVDKISFDKGLSEQVEAIQCASMNAMASLLYGPCFDDNARKMSGRVISWVNSLFIEPAPRAPFGYSPADPRTPSHSKHTEGGWTWSCWLR